MRYTFSADIWIHVADNPWYFVTVPEDISDSIEQDASTAPRGFGAVRVRATVGETRWATSVFPDTKRKAYLLPIKRPIRIAENLEAGDTIDVILEIVLDGG
jgi:Domain of unknown function (DUF1905)